MRVNHQPHGRSRPPTLLWWRVGRHPRIEEFRWIILGAASLAELSRPPLLCETLQLSVIIQRARLDFIEGFDVPRSQIDAIHRADRKIRHCPRVTGNDQKGRGEKINAQSKCIANVRWPEKEQYQVWAIVDTPGIERLAEIARLFREALLGRQIEHDRKANDRIDEETGEGDACGLGAPLQ